MFIPDSYRITLPMVKAEANCDFVEDEKTKRKLKVRTPQELHFVTNHSSKKTKKAVERFAHYFRREFQYDFVQFSSIRELEPLSYIAFYWQYDEMAFGAGCFRHREFTNFNGWALQWVWLHPYFRTKGHLKAAWPIFKELCGNFDVEGPYSEAMYQFLIKYNGLKDERI